MNQLSSPESDSSCVQSIPEPGQIVEIRRRQWIVSDVQGSVLSRNDDQHLVTAASLDEDALGEEMQAVWTSTPRPSTATLATQLVILDAQNNHCVLSGHSALFFADGHTWCELQMEGGPEGVPQIRFLNADAPQRTVTITCAQDGPLVTYTTPQGQEMTIMAASATSLQTTPAPAVPTPAQVNALYGPPDVLTQLRGY